MEFWHSYFSGDTCQYIPEIYLKGQMWNKSSFCHGYLWAWDIIKSSFIFWSYISKLWCRCEQNVTITLVILCKCFYHQDSVSIAQILEVWG